MTPRPWVATPTTFHLCALSRPHRIVQFPVPICQHATRNVGALRLPLAADGFDSTSMATTFDIEDCDDCTALHCTTPGKPAFALALSDLMVASMLEQEEPIVPGNTTQISPHRVFADPRDTLAIIHVLTWQSYQGDG